MINRDANQVKIAALEGYGIQNGMRVMIVHCRRIVELETALAIQNGTLPASSAASGQDVRQLTAEKEAVEIQVTYSPVPATLLKLQC